jgi:molybdopterin molybdotransferase
LSIFRVHVTRECNRDNRLRMISNHDAPQRIAKLTPLGDVLVRLDALVKPVAACRADLAGARGRVVAEDVVIPLPLPPASVALRDGWAVRSELTADAGGYAPMPLPAAARIEAGQPLPAGADAVAPFDAVTVRDGQAQALAPVGPGDGVLPAGADVAAGTTLLSAGRRLGRAQLALLAAAGVAEVQVRAPRVRLLRTRPRGDAILDAAAECIADSIAQGGGVLVVREPDARLELGLTDPDIDGAVAIGGTGSGHNDATVRVLAGLGEVVAHGIALLPGETTAFGMVGSRPVLALPGRLDAALAAWHVLGWVMLARLSGSRKPLRLRMGKLASKVSSALGYSELVPVHCEGLAVTPIASGYVPLSALAQANGWIFIKPDSEGYPAGSEVVVRPWP